MHIKTFKFSILCNEVKKFLLLIIKIKIFMNSMCEELICGYFPPKDEISLVGILDHASISVNNNAIPSFYYKP
jgi:hypothetical protein